MCLHVCVWQRTRRAARRIKVENFKTKIWRTRQSSLREDSKENSAPGIAIFLHTHMHTRTCAVLWRFFSPSLHIDKNEPSSDEFVRGVFNKGKASAPLVWTDWSDGCACHFPHDSFHSTGLCYRINLYIQVQPRLSTQHQ